MRVALLLLAALLVGCAAPEGEPATTTTRQATTTTTTAPTAQTTSTPPTATTPPTSTTPAPTGPAFPRGICYRAPDAFGTLTCVDAKAPKLELPIGGFDLEDGTLVYADGAQIHVVSADGSKRSVTAKGLGHVARPSLLPDGKSVVVQATFDQPHHEPPRDLSIHVVDLATGDARLLVNRSGNEESPECCVGGNVVYSSFSPKDGVDMHFIALNGTEMMRVDDAGAIHIAVSKDQTRILDPGRVRIYDAKNGSLVADLKAKVVAALKEAGYEPDARFPGQANRGTFPLDGDFSPDGTALVLDGAVQSPNGYGLVVVRVNVDGTGFAILAGPVPVDPGATNQHNYSQTNPVWR